MGYTEILGKVSGKDPVAAELVKPIMEATNKGRELVRQLLLFSRKKMPELKPLDLPSITGNFIRLLERVLEENITIITDIPKVLPPVMGDAGQIEQVLMNLCINARDAMPEGGRIEIALRDYTCDKSRKLLEGTVEPGEYVILSVRDSGPGIPPENHSMIFEPFYTTKQVDQGTGLGLSTVLGIMESHEGAIQAGNSIEGGFEISLYFPVSSDQQECRREIKEREHGHRSDIHSITVLVAEDDPPVRELTMEGLGAAGIKAVSASNGLEAVEVFMKNPDRIDLLVFDVVMPNMNGPDAYREIREAGFDVPVIFTTGYAGDSLKGLPGKHRLINKPYGISKLVHIIAEELGTSED